MDYCFEPRKFRNGLLHFDTTMNHPFRQYYSSESTSNLRLTVVLYQVSGHTDIKEESNEDEESSKKQVAEKPKNAKKTGPPRLKQTFLWQQKKFSPQEIHNFRQHSGTSQNGRNKALTKNSRFLVNQYRGLLQQQFADTNIRELIQPVMLFNYIDKDSYESGKRKMTSSFVEEPTPLAQEVLRLNAHFEPPSDSWVETMSSDMAHIAKDLKFRTMQIMLASNVTLVPVADNAADNNKVIDKDTSEVAVSMSESMLACVRAFANSSRIDIQPALNPLGSEDPFLRAGSEVPDVQQPFWYTLVTSSNQTFRYTIYNESELQSAEMLEAVHKKEHEMYEREQTNLQNQVGFTFHGAPHPGFSSRIHTLMEIVSASEFVGAEFLYVRYKILLPSRGWEWTSQILHGSRRTMQPDSEIVDHGSTQTTRVVFRPPRFNPSVHHCFGSSVREESLAHFCFPIEMNVALRETVRNGCVAAVYVHAVVFMVRTLYNVLDTWECAV